MPSSYLEPDLAGDYDAYRLDPSPANADRLVTRLRPSIDAGVRRHIGPDAAPSLRLQARHMALDSVRTYDPSRGPLGAHVATGLQGLKRHALRQQQMLAVPDRVAQDHYRLEQARRRLADDLLRDPSDLELADATGLSLKRIGKVRGFRPGFAQGQLETPRPGPSGELDDPAPAVDRPDPIASRIEFLYHDLDPVDQALVDNHFGLRGRKRLSGVELARRLNLSPSALSQRAARIQSALDELGLEGL